MHSFGMTAYGNAKKAAKYLSVVQPDFAILHGYPGEEDEADVVLLSSVTARPVIFGIPGNGLADDTAGELDTKITKYAKWALEFGVSELQLNLEIPNKKGAPGWAWSKDKMAEGGIRQTARLFDALRGHPELAWTFTSHDWPSHPLPWTALLGVGTPFVNHYPQVYPATKRPGTSHSGCVKRMLSTRKRWNLYRDGLLPGTLETSLLPKTMEDKQWFQDTPSFSTYMQAWGMSPRSMVRLAMATPKAVQWSWPDDAWVTEGLAAAVVIAELKRRYRTAASPVLAYQMNSGLVADDDFGKNSAHHFYMVDPVGVEKRKQVIKDIGVDLLNVSWIG